MDWSILIADTSLPEIGGWGNLGGTVVITGLLVWLVTKAWPDVRKEMRDDRLAYQEDLKAQRAQFTDDLRMCFENFDAWRKESEDIEERVEQLDSRQEETRLILHQLVEDLPQNIDHTLKTRLSEYVGRRGDKG